MKKTDIKITCVFGSEDIRAVILRSFRFFLERALAPSSSTFAPK